MVCKTIS